MTVRTIFVVDQEPVVGHIAVCAIECVTSTRFMT
jgi:hypothetical protein